MNSPGCRYSVLAKGVLRICKMKVFIYLLSTEDSKCCVCLCDHHQAYISVIQKHIFITKIGNKIIF